MIERIKQLTPFTQVIALILLGGVSFVFINIISIFIITSLYPEMPTNDIGILYEKYPVQFLFMYYLPFQLGFLLVPGLLYYWISRAQSTHFIQRRSLKWMIWAFLLLPFFQLLNESIAQYLGVYDVLAQKKQFSDQQLAQIIGEKASGIAYFTALIIIGVVPGIAEEFAFRRFLFRHMWVNTNKLWLSVFGSAFVFALLHFNYIQFIPLMAFGIALAIMYHASGSIWPGIIVHALNNLLNVYWLRNDSFPDWLEAVDPKITIPSTLLLMGLIWVKYLKKQ